MPPELSRRRCLAATVALGSVTGCSGLPGIGGTAATTVDVVFVNRHDRRHRLRVVVTAGGPTVFDGDVRIGPGSEESTDFELPGGESAVEIEVRLDDEERQTVTLRGERRRSLTTIRVVVDADGRLGVETDAGS